MFYFPSADHTHFAGHGSLCLLVSSLIHQTEEFWALTTCNASLEMLCLYVKPDFLLSIPLRDLVFPYSVIQEKAIPVVRKGWGWERQLRRKEQEKKWELDILAAGGQGGPVWGGQGSEVGGGPGSEQGAHMNSPSACSVWSHHDCPQVSSSSLYSASLTCLPTTTELWTQSWCCLPAQRVRHSPIGLAFCCYELFFFFPFIFISWRLITLQYCSGFCHTLTWISHGFCYELLMKKLINSQSKKKMGSLFKLPEDYNMGDGLSGIPKR